MDTGDDDPARSDRRRWTESPARRRGREMPKVSEGRQRYEFTPRRKCHNCAFPSESTLSRQSAASRPVRPSEQEASLSARVVCLVWKTKRENEWEKNTLRRKGKLENRENIKFSRYENRAGKMVFQGCAPQLQHD